MRAGRQGKADQLVVRRSSVTGISSAALQGGCRCWECTNPGKELVRQFLLEWGLSCVETGTKSGISSSAASRILKRIDR
jgi:hypothetical protein